MTTTIEDKLNDPPTTAKRLGVTVPTLATWRCNKRYALEYVKIGRRKVMYRDSAIERFISANTVGASA